MKPKIGSDCNKINPAIKESRQRDIMVLEMGPKTKDTKVSEIETSLSSP